MARGLPTGGQESKVYVLCAEPKEHKRFRPGTQPGGIGFPAGRIGDRGDREIVYVPNVYVPFPAPNSKPLRGLNRAIVVRDSVQNPFRTSAKQKRDTGCDSQPHPRPRLNSQLQGATKDTPPVCIAILLQKY